MSNQSIRRLRTVDEAALARFFRRNDRPEITATFHPFPLTAETAAALLAVTRRDLFFGQWADGELVAFSMLRGYDEGYAIPSFGIIVDYQHYAQGIGGRLTRWTCRYAAQIGAPRVRLRVYRDNTAAVRAYDRVGFVVDETASSDDEQVMFWTPPTPVSVPSLYASTACLRPAEPFAERVQTLLDHGLLHVEFGGYPGAGEDDIRAQAGSPIGRFLMHNYCPADQGDFVLNLSSPTAEIRQRSIDFYARSIRLSGELRASHYSLHGGFIFDPIGRDDHGFLFPGDRTDAHRVVAIQRFFASLGQLTEIAATCGVTILVENNVCNTANRDALLFDKPDDFSRLVQAPDLLDVGILLDTGHLKVSAHTYGFQMKEMSEHKARIHGIHLHENDGLADRHAAAGTDSECLALAVAVQPEFIVNEAGYGSLGDLVVDMFSLEWLLDPHSPMSI